MKFTPEEDQLIREEVARSGPRCWVFIAAKIPNRTARQVRERWKNYLCADVNNGPWAPQEDELLIALMAQIGPKWSQLVPHFTNRTDVNLKNRAILLNRRKRRFVKTAAKYLSPEHRRKLTDPVSRDTVIPYLQALLDGLPESQPKRGHKVGTAGPADGDGDLAGLPLDMEPNYDDLGSIGYNYELDLEPMWT
jgi:hypothetical protein